MSVSSNHQTIADYLDSPSSRLRLLVQQEGVGRAGGRSWRRSGRRAFLAAAILTMQRLVA